MEARRASAFRVFLTVVITTNTVSAQLVCGLFDEFQCGEGSCVLQSARCDGVLDCPDSSDENYCPAGCTSDKFQCGGGSCVPQTAKCDGYVDCPDSSDEKDCLVDGDIELQVMVDGGGADIVEKDGWVTVTEKGMSQVSLTCTAHLFPSGATVSLHSPVLWKKDNDDLPQHNSSIVPANIFLPFQAQGTYWCEMRQSSSTAHYVSKKVLLTLEGQEVLLLHLHEHHIPPYPPITFKDLETKVHKAFSDLLQGADYITNAVSINTQNLTSDTFVNSRVQIQLSSTTTAFEKLLEIMHNEHNITDLLKMAGFLYSSMAFFPTRCRQRTDILPYGNSVTWPFSEVGEVQPLHYRCEDAYGNLVVGHCRWNYTHGAAIHFDRHKCKRFDFCPREYTGLAGTYCVSRTAASTWDEGFHAAYTSKHTMSLLDTAQAMLYKKGHEDLSLHQVRQWLEDDGGSSQLWLPAKRLTPFAPLVILSPSFIQRYESSSYSSGWLGIYNVTWAVGQPSADHDCLALDTKTFTMLTLPCDNALPFVTLIYMRELFEVPNWTSKKNTPGLITHDNLMCPGWSSSEYPGGQEVCFTVCQNEPALRWDEAMELCKEKEAQLPDPSNGFLDWVLRQYMFSFNESIWISFPHPESNKTEGRSTFLNWKAETDHSLPYPALTSSGWTRHSSEVTKTHVMCQKNIFVPERNIQVFESRNYVHVAVQPQTETLPQCYVNGHWKYLVKPPEYSKEIGFETDFIIDYDMEYNYNDDYDNGSGDEEPDPSTFSEMIVTSTNQGYYKCWVWTDSPPYFLLSTTLLFRQADTFTFAIVLSRQTPYIPELHDAAKHPRAFPPDEPCMDNFLRMAQMEMVRLYNFSTVITENFYFSPEVETNNLLLHFHVKFDFAFLDEIPESLEITSYEIITTAFNQLSRKDCRAVSARSTIGCYEKTQGNLTWPRTMGARVVLPIELCVTEEGSPVIRECLGDFISGYYWGNKCGECTDQLSNRTQQLWSINQISSSSDSAILAEVTDHGDTLTTTDVYFTAKKIQSISNEPFVSSRNLDHIVKTLNNVMEAEDKVIQQMQDDFNTSSILLQAFETISFKTKLPLGGLYDSRLVSLARFNLMPSSSIIGYHSWRTSEEEKEDEDENVIKKENKEDWQRSQVSLILPDNLTQQVAEYSTLNGPCRELNKVQIMFALYRNSKLFDDHNSFPNHSVDGHVIQAAYRGHTITDLDQPVKIYFKTRSTGYNSKCVFWDFMMNNGLGGWSTMGCWNTGRHGDHVLCLCYHLTSFAHLVNFDEESLGSIHEVILDTISIIGCVLSITALVMVLVTFLLFKKWRHRISNQILVSLASAIMISLIVFLTGIQQTSNLTMCRAAAVTLHYFILASFGWMLVEAVHQYLRFVKVLGAYIPRFMRKASMCAWGIPLVPIIIVLAYDPSLYDSDRDAENVICWMSSMAFSYAFLPPLIATMATNLVLFGLIIHSTTCGRVRVTSTQSERQRRIIQLQMAISVFSLLGFTWLFGLLTFWHPNLVFSYLFCITNTTQGFFIFFFHVFRERDARKLWKDWLPKIGRDLSASQNSPSLPKPKTSEIPQNSSATAITITTSKL